MKVISRFSLWIALLSISSLSIAQNYTLEEYTFENQQHGQDASVVPNLGCSGNCPTISNEFARSGNHSMRTFVDRINSPNMYRTEVAGTRINTNSGSSTQDYWMGFSIYIPGPYPKLINPVYEIVFQLHASPVDGNWSGYSGGNPHLALFLSPLTNTSGQFRVWIRGTSAPYPQTSSNVVFNEVLMNYETDKWYDFVIHTRLDHTNGFTKLWINNNPLINYTGSNYYLGHGRSYPKFGIYNGWRDRTINEPVTTRTLYHDDFRLAWGSGADYNLVAPGNPVSVEKNPTGKGTELFYPNPIMDDQIVFRKTSDITLYSLPGNMISSYSGISYLNVSGLEKGIYFVVNQEGRYQKLIKH